MQDVGVTGEKLFKSRIRGGPKTGRKYPGRRQSSAAGEYPANQTGGLLKSVKSNIAARSAEIGSNQFYSKFLSEGTTRMSFRKMSIDALGETIDRTRRRMKPFIRWKRNG